MTLVIYRGDKVLGIVDDFDQAASLLGITRARARHYASLEHKRKEAKSKMMQRTSVVIEAVI